MRKACHIGGLRLIAGPVRRTSVELREYLALPPAVGPVIRDLPEEEPPLVEVNLRGLADILAAKALKRAE